VTSSTEGLDVNVEGGKSLDQKVREALVGLAENFDLASLCLESEVIMQRRPAWQDFASIPVEPPPGAFLQATKEGEQVLRADVQATVGSASKIIDLFAGCGTFALPLAASGPVHAVECDPHMVAAMDKAWRHRPGLKKLTLETRDLFRNPLTRDELRCADAVVIDPPRAGALAQVAELAVSGVPRIAYVSCDPATFAREAHTLVQNGYALDAVRVVDQFRWSSHVEIVAGFSHSSTR
jgi:23S rRNA (uracil1939-C5)-methyltransferase